MQIRITKSLFDIPESHRPWVGKTYEVVNTISGTYKPFENYIHVIECKGHLVNILASECEVVKDAGHRYKKYR